MYKSSLLDYNIITVIANISPQTAIYHLVNLMNITATKASEYTGIMIGKSDRTVRQWQAEFRENGSIPDSKQGRYQRTGILWSCEDLNRKATKYVRENANVKGRPNLTTHSFCVWVNEELLTNEILESGFPRHISVETARKWLHELGFEVLSADKGMFLMVTKETMWLKSESSFWIRW